MPLKRTVFITSLGVALEYYDFVIYALMANYLSLLFFPASEGSLQWIQSFAVFSIAYFARPIGGLLFGRLGDRSGRKKSFLISTFMMASATSLIGLLPVYDQVGLWAPVLLLTLRIVQGLSFGAEFPAAITFLCEHAEDKKRGYLSALMFSGVCLGALSASLVSYLLHLIFSKEEFLSFAWRFPFLLGAILAVVAFFVRRDTVETELFIKNKKPQLSFRDFAKKHAGALVKGCCIVFLPASMVIFALLFPSLFSKHHGYELNDIYFCTSGSLLFFTLIIPFLGAFSDRIGRRKLLLSIAFFVICAFYFLLEFIFNNAVNVWYLLIFMCAYQSIIAVLSACYPAILSELFPTESRLTGVALCYNFAYCLASTVPMLLFFLLDFIDKSLAIYGVFACFALICLVSAFFIKDHTAKPLL